jgi:DnaK suppressor protein
MAVRALRSAQVEALKRRIARRHEELLGETREDVERSRAETYGALAGPVTDMADCASAALLSDLNQAEISRDVREVSELEAALARIDEGTFGSCTECGNEISFKRLVAYPVARRCVPCQRLHEQAFSTPGQPGP